MAVECGLRLTASTEVLHPRRNADGSLLALLTSRNSGDPLEVARDESVGVESPRQRVEFLQRAFHVKD